MKTNEQRTPEERASALAQSLHPDGELRAARLLPALRRQGPPRPPACFFFSYPIPILVIFSRGAV